MRSERHKSAIGCVCAVLDDRQFASFVSFLYSKIAESPATKMAGLKNLLSVFVQALTP